MADCPYCGNLGFVRLDVQLDDPRFGRLAPCPKCGARREEERQARLMAVLGDLIARYTAMRGRLQECRFDNFDRQHCPAVYNAVVRWVDADDSLPWLYLYGPPGNGKTHLAAAAVNTLLRRGRPALFVTGPDLLALIRSGFETGDAETIIGLCQEVPVLVVDDLGTEQLTPWAAEVFFRVFNARYAGASRTMVVSNVAPADISEPRLASRFQDTRLCRVAANSAPDFRLGKGKGAR